MAFNRGRCNLIEDKFFVLTLSVACGASKCPFNAFNCLEVPLANPFCIFVGVSTLRPTPKVLPQSMRDVAEGFFAHYTFVIVSKTPENWIELFNQNFLFYTT